MSHIIGYNFINSVNNKFSSEDKTVAARPLCISTVESGHNMIISVSTGHQLLLLMSAAENN